MFFPTLLSLLPSTNITEDRHGSGPDRRGSARSASTSYLGVESSLASVARSCCPGLQSCPFVPERPSFTVPGVSRHVPFFPAGPLRPSPLDTVLRGSRLDRLGSAQVKSTLPISSDLPPPPTVLSEEVHLPFGYSSSHTGPVPTPPVAPVTPSFHPGPYRVGTLETTDVPFLTLLSHPHPGGLVPLGTPPLLPYLPPRYPDVPTLVTLGSGDVVDGRVTTQGVDGWNGKSRKSATSDKEGDPPGFKVPVAPLVVSSSYPTLK